MGPTKNYQIGGEREKQNQKQKPFTTQNVPTTQIAKLMKTSNINIITKSATNTGIFSG